MKIALIDNLDSFTYNLVHYLEGLGCDVVVSRSVNVAKLDLSGFDGLVLSPGPGLPKDHPGLMEVIEVWGGRKPILGVCLGMQALITFDGGELVNQVQVKHGVAEPLRLLKEGCLLRGFEDDFTVGLYHSWGVKMPDDAAWQVLAKNLNGLPMAVENVERKMFAVQFHPESILTPNGKLILENFLAQLKASEQKKN